MKAGMKAFMFCQVMGIQSPSRQGLRPGPAGGLEGIVSLPTPLLGGWGGVGEKAEVLPPGEPGTSLRRVDTPR